MLRLFLDNYLFYSFNDSENPTDYVITSLKLKKEINTLSSLSFSCYDTHPKFLKLRPKRALVILDESTANSKRCLFIGKVSSVKRNILSSTVDVECEDLLGCLRDEICIDDVFGNDEQPSDGKYVYTYSRLLDIFYSGLTVTNDIYTPHRNVQLGYNTSGSVPAYTRSVASDSLLSDKINSSILGTDFLSLGYSTVIGYTGGVIFPFGVTSSITGSGTNMYITLSNYTVQYRIDVRDISRDELTGFIANYVTRPNPSFIYGDNIINVDIEVSNEQLYSCVLPYMSCDYIDPNNKEQEMFVRKGLFNRSDPFVSNSYLVSRYGKIVMPIDFGNDETKYQDYSGQSEGAIDRMQNALDYKAAQWANKRVRPFCDKYTVNGVDKFFINKTLSPYGRPIDICDLVRIQMPNHNCVIYDVNGNAELYPIDFTDYCLSLEIDFFDHENDRYVIGPYIPDNLLEYNSSYVSNDISKKNKSKWRNAPITTDISGSAVGIWNSFKR